MTGSKLTMHPDTPEWARPMWNLMALVHQGNVNASREAESVRIRVWHAENEIAALKDRISHLERFSRPDTIPAPSPDDEDTHPGRQ